MNLKKIRATQEMVGALKGMAGALSRLNSVAKDWQVQGYLPREGQEKADDVILQDDIILTAEEQSIVTQLAESGMQMNPFGNPLEQLKTAVNIADVYKALSQIQVIAQPAIEEKAGEIPTAILIERL